MRKEIKIAVVATYKGWKQFLNDNSTEDIDRLPHLITFIHIDSEEKCRGTEFNSYILNWSYRELKDRHAIVDRVVSRCVPV